MTGLLAWRFLTPEACAAWDLACSNNAFTAKPAGNTFLSTGYFQLWQLRRRAFPDPTFKTISPSLIVNYPWCLTPIEFQNCFEAINSGQFPQLDGSKPTDWQAELDRWNNNIAPFAFFLPKVAKSLGVRLLLGTTFAGNAISAISIAKSAYDSVTLAALRSAYQTDQKRRDYEAYIGAFI